MGHAVLTCKTIDDVLPFYTNVLGFKLSDYILQPFKAYFMHVNPRHHSLAFIETGENGIHHLMVELFNLDDVGQGYDIIQGTPEKIGTTFGRHVNDHMTSFYTYSPSKFLFEYGWGGRSIDPDTWTPHERPEGPSLWGHERAWLTPEGRVEARDAAHAHGGSRPARAGERDGGQLSRGAGHVHLVGRGQGLRTNALKVFLRRSRADLMARPAFCHSILLGVIPPAIATNSPSWHRRPDA